MGNKQKKGTLPPIDIAVFSIDSLASRSSQKSELCIVGMLDSDFNRLNKFGLKGTTEPDAASFASRNLEIIDFISKNRSRFWTYTGPKIDSSIIESYSKYNSVVFIRKDIASKFTLTEYRSEGQRNDSVLTLDDPATGKHVIDEFATGFSDPEASNFKIKDYLYSSLPKSQADAIIKSRKRRKERSFKL